MNMQERQARDAAWNMSDSYKCRTVDAFTNGFLAGIRFAAQHGYVPPEPPRCASLQPCNYDGGDSTRCQLDANHDGEHRRAIPGKAWSVVWS